VGVSLRRFVSSLRRGAFGGQRARTRSRWRRASITATTSAGQPSRPCVGSIVLRSRPPSATSCAPGASRGHRDCDHRRQAHRRASWRGRSAGLRGSPPESKCGGRIRATAPRLQGRHKGGSLSMLDHRSSTKSSPRLSVRRREARRIDPAVAGDSAYRSSGIVRRRPSRVHLSLLTACRPHRAANCLPSSGRRTQPPSAFFYTGIFGTPGFGTRTL